MTSETREKVNMWTPIVALAFTIVAAGLAVYVTTERHGERLGRAERDIEALAAAQERVGDDLKAQLNVLTRDVSRILGALDQQFNSARGRSDQPFGAARGNP